MSNFLSLVGWYILPRLATSWIQSIYYAITIRAGDPKPAPGSARFLSHRRTINILVVATYLLYTIYEAGYELRAEPSFYQDLGVPLGAADREIKSRFRRLAAMHHPDKAGAAADLRDKASFFMHLKLASDTLQDAARRFAYERFGPDIVEWQKCVTIRDFVSRGVLGGILPHYAVAAATIYVLGLFGYMEFGKFHRWLILITLCVFEVHVVTRPAFPLVVDVVNALITRVSSRAPYLPFQAIQLARKLTITVYIGLAQIGPLLVQQTRPGSRAAQGEDKALEQGLQRLDAVVNQLNTETSRLVAMEMAPFKGDAGAVSNLQGKMQEWLVQNTLRSDPMVRDALGTSFRKRRIDAPSGAKGNR
ncbi:DnaJ domain-containing protein [Hirsutella rhossiliensis]|uniref:DnaJ domain-containing protein n=1 Tax=Hirsutella rhossiliensis TaxID=111463 RepID=A0A9P8MZB5_9HYPO|nr:dnaJ domain-containing protein [Hirsutella rhossiliensis]KAH0963757.1 dnaJ domain-containing protein [Hirsutella rhossiliensis]